VCPHVQTVADFYQLFCELYALRAGAHPEFFFFMGGGGADSEAINNLCLILKIMVQKSCCKYHITLFATACIYIRI
jgi:hypothetical protein